MLALAIPQGKVASTQVGTWDDYGFTVNGVHARGSVLLLPEFWLLWDVQQISDVTMEALTPILATAPKIGTWKLDEHTRRAQFAASACQLPRTTLPALRCFSTQSC